MRYCAYSLDNKEPYIIGDVDQGIDFDKVRPFETVTYKLQSDNECLKCPVAVGCGFCQGFNYDVADTYTNFQRDVLKKLKQDFRRIHPMIKNL